MKTLTIQTEAKEGRANEQEIAVPFELLRENVYDEPGVDSTSAGLFSKPEDCQCQICEP